MPPWIANIPSILAVVVLFGLAIFVHELGHFLLALRCGMVVECFSIGFGPAIWQRKIRGINYKLAWIPLGGYVSLPQLDPTGMSLIQGDNSVGGAGEGKPVGEAKEKKPDLPDIEPWKKILVAAAGAVGNVVLAILLAWLIYAWPGSVTDEGQPLFLSVAAESTSFAAGLRTGDEVVSVNGKPVSTWYDFQIEAMFGYQSNIPVRVAVKTPDGVRTVEVPGQKGEFGNVLIDGVSRFYPFEHVAYKVGHLTQGAPADEAGVRLGDIIHELDGIAITSRDKLIALVQERRDKTVPIVIERDGGRITLQVTPRWLELGETRRVFIGVGPAESGNDLFWMHYKRPWKQLSYDAQVVWRLLSALVTPGEAGHAFNGLGGAPTIGFTLWAVMKESYVNGLGFLRFLCVNLAILNMLPIPVLDGGHIVFALWELLTRRKLHPKLVNTLMNVFATLLIGLMVFIMLRDFVRIPKMLKIRDKPPVESSAAQPVAEPATATNTVAPAPVQP